jgi:hypothetical protein
MLNNLGTVDMTRVVVESNIADQNAAGVSNVRGTMTIVDSSIRRNQALGLNPENYGFTVGVGGGIENVGIAFLSLENTRIQENFAAVHGGGIFNNSPDSVLDMVGGKLIQNEAGLDGGGVFNQGSLTLTQVHVASNDAARYGGGIFNSDGSVTVYGGIFSGNKAELGTAIYSTLLGTLWISDETVISENGIPIFVET